VQLKTLALRIFSRAEMIDAAVANSKNGARRRGRCIPVQEKLGKEEPSWPVTPVIKRAFCHRIEVPSETPSVKLAKVSWAEVITGDCSRTGFSS